MRMIKVKAGIKLNLTEMKTRFLALLLMIGLNAAMYAQSGISTPEERAKRWDDWMKEQLALTPDQQTKVHEINLRYASQSEGLKSAEGTRRSKYQDLKATNDSKDDELKKVFTKEQFKLYQDKKKAFQRQMIQNYRSKP